MLGVGFAGLLLMFSLFQTDVYAQYLRIVAVGCLLVIVTFGILRAIWMYFAYRKRN